MTCLVSKIGPWNLTSSIAKDNIQLNVMKINTVDIPSTEDIMNHYVNRIETLNNAYNNFSYYKWQVECGNSPSVRYAPFTSISCSLRNYTITTAGLLTSRCGEFEFSKLIPPLDIKDISCDLTPLPDVQSDDIPTTMSDRRSREVLLPYIEAFRRIAEATVGLLLEYTTYFLIVKMLSTVLWNFLTRSVSIQL